MFRGGINLSVPKKKNDQKKILSDKNKRGKERPWRDKKIGSNYLADVFRQLYDTIGNPRFKKKENKIRDCGTYLSFRTCPNGHEKKLAEANFCKDRLCPTCSWRKSLKNAFQVKEICHIANERHPNNDFVFLTLTQKNVVAEDLEMEISHLMKSFRRLRRRVDFRNAIDGWFRALEITYNEKKDSYHPHFHILLHVKNSYFGRDYISQKKWIQLWKKSVQVDYNPIVDVRKVKPKKGRSKAKEDKDKYWSAAAEVAKYAVKSSDYLDLDDEKSVRKVVMTLNDALKYRRLTAFGGTLKEIYEELEMDQDEEDEDLIHIDDQEENCLCSVCQSELVDTVYLWEKDNYFYSAKASKQILSS